MADYTPIDCGLYSEYELAILHGKRLRISWCQPDEEPRIDVLKPRDLQTSLSVAGNLTRHRFLPLSWIRK